MRAFIALPLPQTTLQQLIRTTAGLRPKIKKGVRWVSPDNMHLTLRFLGESDPERLEELQEKLQSLMDQPAFELKFTTFGVFPTWKTPSVIWLGFEENNELKHLQHTIETYTRECGFLAEKKAFHPHLTLARVKRPPALSIADQIKHLFKETPAPLIPPFQADHVVLFQSILSPQGAQYKALQTIKLSRD